MIKYFDFANTKGYATIMALCINPGGVFVVDKANADIEEMKKEEVAKYMPVIATTNTKEIHTVETEKWTEFWRLLEDQENPFVN